MDNDDRKPARAPDARADRGARQGVRRDPRRRLRRARRPRPPLHHEHDRDAPQARGAQPHPAARLAPQARLDRRDLDALAGQDPREHGDRPQRHARPVGLDERSPDQLLDLGLGLRVDRRGVEALPQLHPPHLHEHPRQGPRPRLRDHADRSAPEVEPGLPRPAVLQPRAGRVLRVGRGRRTTSTSRPSRRARSPRSRSGASSRAWRARAASRSPRTTSSSRCSAGWSRRASSWRSSRAAFGEQRKSGARRVLEGAWSKASRHAPQGRECSGSSSSAARSAEPFSTTLTADFTANVVRNVWAYAIIFCGHFPDQTYTFSQEETADESRGGYYVRQLLGAANIEGSPLFHVISGNLGYQVEHHLYPDMPSTRYAEIAPRVKELCERYGLPYNTGPFLKQLGMVQRTILRLALPGGKPRPSPAPTAAAGTGRRRRTARAAEPPALGLDQHDKGVGLERRRGPSRRWPPATASPPGRRPCRERRREAPRGSGSPGRRTSGC